MATHTKILDPSGDILVIVPVPAPPPPSSLFGSTASQSASLFESTVNNGAQPSSAPKTPEERWEFKASTKHLALASKYAEKMLSGPWREATKVHDDGLLHWCLEGFNADAVSTVLHVMHGLNRRVPRTVELVFFAQVARVVDYLDCHEIMELYATIWVSSLVAKGSGAVTHSVVECWISIAGVFRNAALFTQYTRYAIDYHTTTIPTIELPVLHKTYDTINQKRQAHLDEILDKIYGFIDQLTKQQTCCDECDSILLGTLMRQMHKGPPSLKLTRPGQQSLFPPTISDTINAIQGLTLPEWYCKTKASQNENTPTSLFPQPPITILTLTKWIGGSYGSQESLSVYSHTCSFQKLKTAVADIQRSIKGLDLKADLGIEPAEG